MADRKWWVNELSDLRAFRDAVIEAYQSSTNASELQQVIGELLADDKAGEV